MSGETYKVIPLGAKDGSIRGYAKVDAADYDHLNQWRWSLDGKGYVKRITSRKDGHRIVKMHRYILGLTDPNQKVDHIDGDKLNNQRANLRIVTEQQNKQNFAHLYANNTSGYRGVSWHKQTKKWCAYVRFNNKKYHLGLFENAEDAAIAAAEWRAINMPFSADARDS